MNPSLSPDRHSSDERIQDALGDIDSLDSKLDSNIDQAGLSQEQKETLENGVYRQANAVQEKVRLLLNAGICGNWLRKLWPFGSKQEINVTTAELSSQQDLKTPDQNYSSVITPEISTVSETSRNEPQQSPEQLSVALEKSEEEFPYTGFSEKVANQQDPVAYLREQSIPLPPYVLTAIITSSLPAMISGDSLQEHTPAEIHVFVAYLETLAPHGSVRDYRNLLQEEIGLAVDRLLRSEKIEKTLRALEFQKEFRLSDKQYLAASKLDRILVKQPSCIFEFCEAFGINSVSRRKVFDEVLEKCMQRETVESLKILRGLRDTGIMTSEDFQRILVSRMKVRRRSSPQDREQQESIRLRRFYAITTEFLPPEDEFLLELKQRAAGSARIALMKGNFSEFIEIEKHFSLTDEHYLPMNRAEPDPKDEEGPPLMFPQQKYDLQSAAKNGITVSVQYAQRGELALALESAEKIRERASLSIKEFQECLEGAILENLHKGAVLSVDDLLQLETPYQKSLKTFAHSAEAKAAAKLGMSPSNMEISESTGRLPCIKKLCKLTGLSDVDIVPELDNLVLALIEERSFPKLAFQLLDTLKEGHDLTGVGADEEVRTQVLSEIRKYLRGAKIHSAQKIGDTLSLDSSVIKEQARGALVDCVQQEHPAKAVIQKLQTKFQLPDALEFYKDQIGAPLGGIIALFNLGTIKELQESQAQPENKEFFDYILEGKDAPSITAEDLEHVHTLRITLLEAEQLKEHLTANDMSFQSILKDGNYSELINQLTTSRTPKKRVWGEQHTEISALWADSDNVVNPFKEGANVFGEGDGNKGSKRMLAYLDRPGLSRHDGLHAFRQVIAMSNASGLESTAFFNNILHQVQMDGATYQEGTAHHHLNAIAQSINLDFEEVLAKARIYPSIEKLQELVTVFQSKQAIFSSWNNLKRYVELSKVLERAKGLEKLQKYREQGKNELCNFAETLAFHKDSQVNIQDVMKFVEHPELFLENGDTHTPREVHDRKKPSNYIEIPHLDLTADQLRDALVEGHLDKLQSFRPLEIRYTVPKNPTVVADRKSDIPSDLRSAFKLALGSRKEGVAGKAKDHKKLFGRAKEECKKRGINFQEYLGGTELSAETKAETESALWDLVRNPDIGLEDTAPKVQAPVETVTFIAKINLKSDPIGILAGNDTACCMPFGSGKNNVYMFNPSTAIFTMQIENSDGTSRTISQSLMTRDKDIKTNIADVVQEMQKAGVKMHTIVSEDVLVEATSFASADNVEVAPNYKGDQWSGHIERVYRDFFHEYMQRYAEKDALNPTQVPVGIGYSDALQTLPKQPNTFAPEAPVGYSDKLHANALKLELKEEYPDAMKQVTEHVKPETASTSPLCMRGVDEMDFTDTLPIAYLEGKIYSDNESLMTYLHNMENALIGKDINNAMKDRPNMSFKYTDDVGKMRGYLLAYEGKFSDTSIMGAKDLQNQEILYIADLAANRENPRAGGSLIKAFVERYKDEYLAKDKLIPLYLEAREQTSFHIIQRKLENISQDMGIELMLEELPTYTRGEDTMHPVVIRPRRIVGELAAPRGVEPRLTD